MDWCDRENKGITHFEFSPQLLPRSSIRFDVFHLRCAVTRRMMENLRAFLLRSTMDVELAKQFSDILNGFWFNYNVLLWNLNRSFRPMIGSELLAFIKNTNKITSFLKEKYQPSPVLADLCKGLVLWEKIAPFLVITKIENENNYKNQLKVFERNLKALYEIGKRSFLTKNPAKVGDNETFYFHLLRLYMPRIAQETFEKHKLGLGIYTMQGFEAVIKDLKIH